MKIFVKSSNRACSLDRCLWSIRETISGHDGIVVLDDGIEERFLERIADKHKEAEIRRSPHRADKQSMSRQAGKDLHRQFVERGWDPIQFWRAEIATEVGTYIAMAEEDCWFRQALDLKAVEENLINRNTVLLDFRTAACETNTRSKEHQFSDELPGPSTLDYYKPAIQDHNDLGVVFSATMAVYRRDYWIRAVGNQANFMQEYQAIKGALEFIAEAQVTRELLRFAHTREWVGCISLISTSRTDSGGKGFPVKINHADYNHAVDEAWLRGEFDPLSGYPGDWPVELLEDFYRDQLGDQRTEEWVAWQKFYGEFYERFFPAISKT